MTKPNDTNVKWLQAGEPVPLQLGELLEQAYRGETPQGAHLFRWQRKGIGCVVPMLAALAFLAFFGAWFNPLLDLLSPAGLPLLLLAGIVLVLRRATGKRRDRFVLVSPDYIAVCEGRKSVAYCPTGTVTRVSFLKAGDMIGSIEVEHRGGKSFFLGDDENGEGKNRLSALVAAWEHAAGIPTKTMPAGVFTKITGRRRYKIPKFVTQLSTDQREWYSERKG